MRCGRPSLVALRAACLAACLATATAARVARADTSPEMRAAAAALFEDGRRLMAAGKHADACPKLEESQRIDPGMGTLFNLAVCYEAVGRTASAWVGFRDVAAQAATAGQAEREKAARARVTALESKLSRLQLVVRGAPAGLEVKRDGNPVSPALLSTALPLDPGQHKITATAPGKEPWETTVRVDQPGATVTVEIPALADKQDKAIGPAPRPDVAAPRAEEPAPSTIASPRPWQMPLGVTLTVVGVGAVAGGVGLGFVAKSGFDASNQSNCSKATNQCNAAGLSERSSAVAKGNAGTGLFVGGAVLAAAGIVVWVTAPRSKAPAVGLGPSGVAVRKAW